MNQKIERALRTSVSVKLVSFLFSLCCLLGSRGDGVPAWVQTMENPISAPVQFYGEFVATGSLSLSIGGVSSAVTHNVPGWICGDSSTGFVDTPLTTVELDIYKTYSVTLAGDNVSTMWAYLFEPRLTDLLSRRGRNAQQYSRYRLYFRKPGDIEWKLLCKESPPSWDKESDGDGNCASVSISFDIQLRPDNGARPFVLPGLAATYGSADPDVWDRDEDPAKAGSAPGDEEPLAITANKDGTSTAERITWSANVGRLWDGRTAGKIRILEAGLTNVLTTLCLVYDTRSLDTNELDVVTNTNTALRQIKAPQTCVDVVTLNSTNYEIRFYGPTAFGTKSGGLYPVSGSPFVTWHLDSSSSNNTFRVQEYRNGVTNNSVVQFTGTNLWTLTRGTGNDARIMTRTVNLQPHDTNFVDRVEIEEIKNGAGTTSAKTGEFWTDYLGTHELTTVTNGLGDAQLINSFTYAAVEGSMQLTFASYSDGFWEKRRYQTVTDSDDAHPPGSLMRIVQPWMDTASTNADDACLVSSYAYGTLGEGSFQLQKWHNASAFPFGDPSSDQMDKVGAATYEEETLFDEDACGAGTIQAEYRQFGDLEHYGQIVRTKTFSENIGRLAGQIYSKSEDTGKIDLYDYLFGVWNSGTKAFSTGTGTNDLEQIIYHGATFDTGFYTTDQLVAVDSGEEIDDTVYLFQKKSTKEVRVISKGNLVSKSLYVYVDSIAGFAPLEQIIFQRDLLGHLTNISRYPAGSSSAQVLYQADWTGSASVPGDLKLSETDKNGTRTLFTYDSLKRLKTSVKEGASITGYPTQAAITNSFDYDASANVLTNTTTSGALTLKMISAFDRAGRLTNSVSVDGLTTTYAYSNVSGSGIQTNITYSSGATQILNNYADRRTRSVTGTAAVNQFYAYALSGESIDDALYPKNVTIITNGTATSGRWQESITDNRNQLAEEVWPGFRSDTVKTKVYNGNGLGGTLSLVSESGWDPDSPYDIETKYDRNEFGDILYTGTDGDSIFGADNVPGGSDRITQSEDHFEQDGSSNWFKVTIETTFPTDGDATPVLVSETKERLTGFTSGQLSQTYSYDADTNLTIATVTVDLPNKKVTTVTTNQQSTLLATQVTVNGLVQTESTTTVSNPTSHYYDALGREVGQVDPLGFTSGTLYASNTSQILGTTNKEGKVSARAYYAPGSTNAGMLYSETGPTGKKTYHAYNLRGEEIQTWGDVPYPVLKIYDVFGNLSAQTTYRTTSVTWNNTSWPSPTGGDVTTWLYDGPTGLLTNKLDATSQGETYDYYVNHMPKATVLARGIGRLATYAPNGDVIELDLTNNWTGSTVISSVISSNYNRMAIPRAIYDDAGLHNLSYDYAGRLLSDACTNGLLSGTVLSYHYDPVKGKDRLTVRTPSGTLLTNQYGFDSFGRISSVANGGVYSASYGYLANSDLLQRTTNFNGSTAVLTTTRTWDFGSRLRSIVSAAGSAIVSSHSYLYDDLDRRTEDQLEDGSRWLYGYDDRDQLVRGHRYWLDWSPVTGQRFEYQYDAIGNRTTSSAGGDTSGANLRSTSYTANSLNQYSTVVTPGYKDISGAAYSTASVTVNSGATDRKGEYFHSELSISNGSSPVWQAVTATTGSTSSNGGFILPKNSQSITYDADGNLSYDGIWNYKWTAENRLASMNMTNTVSGLANGNRLRLDFVYDHEGHRVAKIVSSWNGSTFAGPSTNRFANDGWKLISEMDSSGNPTRSYMWGLDLSGDLDGAAGIGGLLMVRDHSGGGYHFASYDGNGNVMALVNAADQSTSARYEYSPFLDPIRASGAMASLNSICASSKFWDRETGLSDFGERYFQAGRWLSRDPMQEDGGLNLYAFVLNNSIRGVDPFGLNTVVEEEAAGGIGASIVSASFQAVSLYNRVQSAIDTYSAIQTVVAEAADGNLGSEDLIAGLKFAGEAIAERLVGKLAGKLASSYQTARKSTPRISNRSWARENYWRAVAEKEIANPSGRYSVKNLERIAEGKAPLMKAQVRNLKTGKIEERDIPMELHHQSLPHRSGSAKANEPWNLQPAAPWAHETLDEFRRTGYELISIVKGPNSY